MVSINTLLSYREYSLTQLDNFRLGLISEEDLHTIRDFGFELCFDFVPNDTSELYIQIEIEDELDRFKYTLWGY